MASVQDSEKKDCLQEDSTEPEDGEHAERNWNICESGDEETHTPFTEVKTLGRDVRADSR